MKSKFSDRELIALLGRAVQTIAIDSQIGRGMYARLNEIIMESEHQYAEKSEPNIGIAGIAEYSNQTYELTAEQLSSKDIHVDLKKTILSLESDLERAHKENSKLRTLLSQITELAKS